MAIPDSAVGADALSVERLLTTAEAETGLSDWGADQSFHEPLERLVSAVNAMSPPPEFLAMAGARMLGSLKTRLHLVEDEKQHPEILDLKIERPLIVCGLVRTGTTVVYDMMALDPALRSPREWEFFNPWPAPEAATWASDPRIAQTEAHYQEWLKIAPELANIHELSAMHASECNLAFTHHFASQQFIAEWGVPEFEDWLLSGPVKGRYQAHRRLLQELQWKGPAGRWLLKSPEHLFDLQGLIDTYPDASLVWTHRDPVMALSSLSSFLLQFRKIIGFGYDPKEVGRAVLKQWTTAVERGMEARERNPELDKKLIDIPHTEVIADKAGVVQRIYEHAGQPFTAEFETIIKREAETLDSRLFGRLGKHKHNPADFGITPANVRDLMPRYYAKFGHLFDSAL